MVIANVAWASQHRRETLRESQLGEWASLGSVLNFNQYKYQISSQISHTGLLVFGLNSFIYFFIFLLMCKKNPCMKYFTNEMVRKVFVCCSFSLMCSVSRVWAGCDWRCAVFVSPQAPTTTGRCMKPWTSAGSSCESSPRRCWRGFPRAPCPSSTPESLPAATRGRRPDLHLLLPVCVIFDLAVSCFEGHRGGGGSGVRGHSRCSPRVCVLVYGVYFLFVKRCVLIVLMSSLQCTVNSISVPIYLCMLLPYSHPSYFTSCPFAVQIEIIRWL